MEGVIRDSRPRHGDLYDVLVLGGGLAGCTAALAAAAGLGGDRVALCERGPRLLSGWRAREIRESGGGAVPNWNTLSQEGLPPGWLEALDSAGAEEVPGGAVAQLAEDLKRRMRDAGVALRLGAKAVEVVRDADRNFRVWFESGTPVAGRRLILATGGGRQVGWRWAQEWEQPWQAMLPAGLNLKSSLSRSRGWGTLPSVRAELSCRLGRGGEPSTRASGELEGIFPWLGGSALLKASLQAPALFAEADHAGELQVNWLPELDGGVPMREMQRFQSEKGKRPVREVPWDDLELPLWRFIVGGTRIAGDETWFSLGARDAQVLAHRMTATRIPFRGFRMDREGGLHAGGATLRGLVPGSFESLPVPGSFWVGECVDLHADDAESNLQLAIHAGRSAGETAASELRER